MPKVSCYVLQILKIVLLFQGLLWNQLDRIYRAEDRLAVVSQP